jgi:hypothetical protein
MAMKKSILYLLIISGFFSCRSTELIGSWKLDDAPSKKYKDVGVVLMTPNMSTRSIIESDIAILLAEKGVKASPTFDVFPFVAKNELFEDMDEEKLQQYARERVEKMGFDAILMIALLDKSTESQYHQGSSISFAVPAYQYNYYGYYQYVYSTIQAPGYYTVKSTYLLESNLYEVESENLIWTGQTKTKKDASSIHKESKEFANIIVQDMLRKKALVP